MKTIIEVRDLCHYYGKKKIYENINFTVEEGKIVGILGRNGVGKSTLINILTGFLQPTSGVCKIFNEESHSITPTTRKKIGLLYEGHLTYDFFNIEEIEKFYSSFYDSWRKELFYDLIDLLNLPKNHKIRNMSYGQRAQVVLGLIFAQDPELLILDDYSLGLDAGYRRLFLEFLKEFVKGKNKSVVITSHIVNDLEPLVDDVFFIERGGSYLKSSVNEFLESFKCYSFTREDTLSKKKFLETIKEFQPFKNIEVEDNFCRVFTYEDLESVKNIFHNKAIQYRDLQQQKMSLEDAFIGYTGRY